MLAFFKSTGAVQRQPKPEDAHPTVDVAAQDASGPLSADEPETRDSDASIPTIDSVPTIQGPPGDVPPSQTPVQPRAVPLPDSPAPASLVPPSPANPLVSAPSVHTQSSTQSDQPMQTQSQSALPYSPPGATSASKDPRRFSFPSFSFLRSDAKQSKTRTVPPPIQTQVTYTAPKAAHKKSKAGRTLFTLKLGTAASSEKRAKESAFIVRSVIIGDHNAPSNSKSTKSKPVSKFDIARAKSQLLDPKAAPKVFAQLRLLPAHPNDVATSTSIPIHAVCLDMPDKDVYEQHFARLQSVALASVSAVSAALADMHLVDLITAPNMGFGAPVTAQGLFAGAVPTAETVVDGIEQITPQLMALGYATGKVMLPDHKGVIVPTDRISVLTYWWGLELCLPPPTIAQLEAAESPATALLNLLTAISVLNEGVREILPFIRYIAQFVQIEWSMIKRADEGDGVVCTATWLLPVALVPRAWDFPDLPPPHVETVAPGQSTPTSPSVKRFSATLTTPKPSTEVPAGVPRSSSAYSAETKDDEDSRPIISSEPPVLPELVVSSPGSIDGAPAEVDEGAHNAHEKVQHGGIATAH